MTFNITLKNFIRDKLNRVDEDFLWNAFTIINYHQFIKSELNNLNIEFDNPSHSSELINEGSLDNYFERHYYGNIKLFEKHKDQIRKYDAVLIDEIQDYNRSWMDIIKNYFRDPQGDYVLFGDVKQNIYNKPTEKRDVVTNVKGVVELKYCFRSDFKVRDLAQSFQKSIFKEKYEADSFAENGKIDFFGQMQNKEGYVNYMKLSNEATIPTLYNIIRGNILNKESKTSPNDITILGFRTALLRDFEVYYRYKSREKTNSMLETIETMYMKHLNYLGGKTCNTQDKIWFDNISARLAKKLFHGRQLYTNDFIVLRLAIARLFTIYDLSKKYGGSFDSRLNEECEKYGITSTAFIAFYNHYYKLLSQFKKNVYNDDYKDIRDNKKFNFWMNSGTIKISTINSFKGWESKVVFIVLEPRFQNITEFNSAFDELLYTGLTRSKSNLVILNFGNEEYDLKIRPLINSIK